MNENWTCPQCGVEGFNADCPNCDGDGNVWDEEFGDYVTCDDCLGLGALDDEAECPECGHTWRP